jgi:hypothetical protein
MLTFEALGYSIYEKDLNGELIAMCVAANGGSVIIGILGVLLTIRSYPNAEFEYGAALVGAALGSLFSIPLVDNLVGNTIMTCAMNQNDPDFKNQDRFHHYVWNGR